ncbi:MAG: tRNA (adenosine(37)-N6)-dimethylallyltransferase MiaA [Mucinivorans sp.]
MGRLVVIQGATAAGKSAVAVSLATHYACPVVSCDSRQFYREMTIGTAVPSVDEQQAVAHYFIQDRSINEPLTAGAYEIEALALLDKLFAHHSTVILVGGSGLYADALVYGLDPLPTSEVIRAELNSIYERQGLAPLVEALRMADPVHYSLVDRQNPLRVIRALEVCRASGMPYSNLRTARHATRPFEVVRLAIDMPRQELYNRINGRVDQMIEQGLEDEVRSLIPYRDLSPLRTVGYSEFFDYFDGKISHDTAIDKIKQNTRNYAKRQLTWLRREGDLRYFAPHAVDEIIAWMSSINYGNI